MKYVIEISPDAAKDIDSAYNYYNEVSPGLGYEFVAIKDKYLNQISKIYFMNIDL